MSLVKIALLLACILAYLEYTNAKIEGDFQDINQFNCHYEEVRFKHRCRELKIKCQKRVQKNLIKASCYYMGDPHKCQPYNQNQVTHVRFYREMAHHLKTRAGGACAGPGGVGPTSQCPNTYFNKGRCIGSLSERILFREREYDEY